MNNEFEKVMLRRSDADLLEIINSPAGDYQDAAVEAAKREIDRRNLSANQVANAIQEIDQIKHNNKIKANLPLGIGWKIFTAMVPGIIQLMFAGTLKADGYDRKAKEMFRWTLYGVFLYISFFILMFVLAALF